ncbi:MAG TPA: four helix bundle protein [Verrucomicrobiota bacterium]|nr:four helix bundle protein [Verrucomicrobiota bacterium]HNT15327.1 four helix bundle protein [Verrucomicrobiota bacterium]
MPEERTRKVNPTKRATPRDNSPTPPSPSYPGFIPTHGGYEDLLAYRKSQIIYDATVRFCDRFIDRKSRTHDQMVQAARSGNKNISEGSQVSGTSKESEIKLTGVARGSLEELLGDDKDCLRQRGFREWDKNDREALYVRKLGARNDECYEDYRSFIESRPAETVANILICLIPGQRPGQELVGAKRVPGLAVRMAALPDGTRSPTHSRRGLGPAADHRAYRCLRVRPR